MSLLRKESSCGEENTTMLLGKIAAVVIFNK